MCQRARRYIQKRIVHLRDEAAGPANQDDRPVVERVIEELQAVLRTIEGAGDDNSQILQNEDWKSEGMIDDRP